MRCARSQIACSTRLRVNCVRLFAETSCEMRNLFLDRTLLVPTMAMDGPSFFEIGGR